MDFIFDLGVLSKRNNIINFQSSLKLSLLYIGVGCLFGLWIYYELGSQSSAEYFNAFFIEKALALDNIFVISIIFRYFDIKLQAQHRVLFWGILSVIVLRGIMIYFGAILIEQFEWILYIFGIFLILTGIKILVTTNHKFDPSNNFIIKIARKYLNISDAPEMRSKFWFIKDNKTYFTYTFLALILIEIMDLIFALDSIPAVFAITHDIYIVYTSNIFAILGLRALYFCLADLVERFQYLKYSLGLVLIFIGSKIFIIHIIEKIPSSTSLFITFAILMIGVLASLLKQKRTLQN